MRQLRSLTSRMVCVTIDGDSTAIGVVDEVGKDCLFLKDAGMTTAGSDPLPVDGLLAIPWARILYLQVPT